MLEKEFRALVARYTTDPELTTALWKEIKTVYEEDHRQFHNLYHLEQIITALFPVKSQVEDWDTLLFAVFYHDFVYDVVQYVTDNNNEDKSADKAEEVLKKLNYPAEKIERCRQHILATKKHELSSDADTNFLTDADLSILGQTPDEYEAYQKNIRKEYFIYPDPIYHAGRQKVLRQFLHMKRLYKTDAFYQQYEELAKENLQRELEIISFA
jgi:predicted metal-dependent HD superfamily phosphohydrolase